VAFVVLVMMRQLFDMNSSSLPAKTLPGGYAFNP